MKSLEAKLFGRVQLVMFRDFTRRKARGQKLTGFVKNMPDGSVYVIAEGEEDRLKIFLQKLRKGSLLSRVDRVEEKWGEGTGAFEEFVIAY